MSKYEKEPPEEISKTTIKNEMIALQKMGEALVSLAESQLEQIPLPDNLLQAIRTARTLKSHESIRRQMQYIGKLMREVDIAEIQLALKRIQLSHEIKTAEFHQAEKWRERIISEGDTALQEFLSGYPKADRQALRQLMRSAQQDRKNNKNSGAEKELFRSLRDLIAG